MEIHTNIPLKNYTTMKLGGNARFMTDVHTPDEVAIACRNANKQNVPIFILGGGSNIIVRDEGFNGLVVHVRISGFEIIADEPGSTTIRIGGGENWDSVVQRIVEMNLSGIECLSGIPGTAGAAPVQNLGAYGQEISDALQSLEAYDINEDKFITLQNEDCEFRYRDSIFRSSKARRYVITSITLKLSKNTPQPPFYESLQKYLDENGIRIYTADIIRNAVLEVRKSKLPDPNVLPNTGSFFKNPIIEKWQLDDLLKKYPNMPHYDMADGRYKIPSGWLIENSGQKGTLINGVRVYENNALVLVNESAKSYSDLATARDEIAGKVRDTFRIQIEQEPIEI